MEPGAVAPGFFVMAMRQMCTVLARVAFDDRSAEQIRRGDGVM